MTEEQKEALSNWVESVHKQLTSITEALIKLETKITQLENNNN